MSFANVSSQSVACLLILLILSFAEQTFFFFFFGYVGSSFLREGPLQLQRVGATPHRGAQASHYRGLSCCGAQAPDAQAQQLWLTGPAAPRHVGSPQTRARTRVPCTGRQTPNHRATREARTDIFNFNKVQFINYLFHRSCLCCHI